MNDLPHIAPDLPWTAGVKAHPSQALGFRAELARDIAVRLALVAAMPDGEDSSGRQKFRMMEPDEVADRACAIADQLVGEFERREWMIDLPAPKPVEEKP